MTLAKGSVGVVVAALCFCIAVEGWIAIAHPFARLPVATIEQGELFNSMRDIAKQTRDKNSQPYMVLLGSSLVVAPVVQAESQHRKRAIKRFYERRATACEEQLRQCISLPSSQQVQIFNAAVGGGMASDDYFVARELLESKHKPVALVCGVAPRDFQDNLVPGMYSTSAFQILSNLSDVKNVFSDESLTLDKKFDIAMGRVSNLWRNRAEVKSFFGLLSKKLIEKTCPFILFEKYGGTSMALAPQKDGIFPEEVKGTPYAYPGYAIDHYEPKKTCEQYMRSYNPVDKRMVDEQFDYFDRTLELAQKHGVEVLVVNMPLSLTNKTLLAPGFYESYLTKLKSICATRSVQLTDFNNSSWDKEGNFIDTVHISAERSNAFIRALMESVAQSPLSVALSGEHKQQIGAKSISNPQ